ncbi:MAG: hypothetical protein WAK11_07330 [Candidatus Cybelea sp.]
MRYALVRIWAVLTVGLLAGVLGDAGTELFGLLGWLGGATRDVDHQGLLPALAITLTLALGLAAYVVGSRIAPSDPLLRRLDDAGARVVDAIGAFVVSGVAVVAIECYETHFGGLAPFDARSVVIAHAPMLVLSVLTIALGARMTLGAAIRCAVRGGAVAAALLTSFLRILRSYAATPKHSKVRHSKTSRSRAVSEIVSSRGLRAPPRLLPTPV